MFPQKQTQASQLEFHDTRDIIARIYTVRPHIQQFLNFISRFSVANEMRSTKYRDTTEDN